MSKPSLLFVSNVAPDANGYGASIRAWHQISWLSKHYSIDLEIASARISDIERGIPSDLYPLCNRITPVSYTHLDVYKRQDLDMD